MKVSLSTVQNQDIKHRGFFRNPAVIKCAGIATETSGFLIEAVGIPIVFIGLFIELLFSEKFGARIVELGTLMEHKSTNVQNTGFDIQKMSSINFLGEDINKLPSNKTLTEEEIDSIRDNNTKVKVKEEIIHLQNEPRI